MNIAVLGIETSWYVQELWRVARVRGHCCSRVEFTRLEAATLDSATSVRTNGASLTELDAVIVRTMPPGSLEQVVFRMDVLQRCEAAGVVVLNPPKAIECAVDKFLTTSRLAAAGLPTPRTIVCESADLALEAFESLGRDVVVKPIFGSEGRGILRVSDVDLAQRAFKTLERISSVLYVQEFILHGGFDVRALVLDGAVLGCIKRTNSGDFRTNVARQGRAEPYAHSPEEDSLATRAASATGACFAGVDLLYDPQGRCHVIEVNAVPGWRAFQRATGLDVAARVIESLEKRTK